MAENRKFAKMLKDQVMDRIPSKFKDTVMLRSFGLLKIPMLFFISPSVVELDDERCVVKVRLSRRTKNHLNSMYFGVLAAGADCAGGLMAMRLIQGATGKGKASLLFKDFHAEFLKRAEGDVLFTCTQGAEIQAMVNQALDSGERQNLKVHVSATVPSKFGDEPVAKFILTLSIKKKSV